MIIDNSPKELETMKTFHREDGQEDLRLQEEFVSEFREEYKNKDRCPCKKACRYHGDCKECVTIRRAYQERIPNCMGPMINQKVKLLLGLTEHTTFYEIEPPKEMLRKE